jgi:hypothetical protein
MASEQEIRLAVTKYLNRLFSQGLLRHMTVDKAMIEVRQWIRESADLSDSDLRSVVLGYFLSHYVYLPVESIMPSPNSRASEIIDAVKKALTLAIDGVPVVDTVGGKITISVKGLTAKMGGEGPDTSLKVSWTGTLSAVVSGGNFTLKNSLSQKSWSMSLSYPKDTAVFDFKKLGQVFGQSGNALSGIVEETFGMTNVKDVRSYVDRISPYIGPVSDAMAAAQGIATRPKQGLSVNISVGSPDPSPGQTGMPGGVQAFVTVTYSW